MKYFVLVILFAFSQVHKCYAQSDWLHKRVYKINARNNFISKEGKLIFKVTKNASLKRATYYEYLNNKVQATTNYWFDENGRAIYFIFRGEIKTNDFVQIVKMPSSSSPSYSVLVIANNQKKEATDHGLIYGLYRSGNFIDLLYIKSIQENLRFKTRYDL